MYPSIVIALLLLVVHCEVATSLTCFWCSGVDNDRMCETRPRDVMSYPAAINCSTKYCLSTKVIDSVTRIVRSFARLCDNIPRGNVCVRDNHLITCFETCTRDLCNSGNPDPSYLPTHAYSAAFLGLPNMLNREVMSPKIKHADQIKTDRRQVEQRYFNHRHFDHGHANAKHIEQKEVHKKHAVHRQANQNEINKTQSDHTQKIHRQNKEKQVGQRQAEYVQTDHRPGNHRQTDEKRVDLGQSNYRQTIHRYTAEKRADRQTIYRQANHAQTGEKRTGLMQIDHRQFDNLQRNHRQTSHSQRGEKQAEHRQAGHRQSKLKNTRLGHIQYKPTNHVTDRSRPQTDVRNTQKVANDQISQKTGLDVHTAASWWRLPVEANKTQHDLRLAQSYSQHHLEDVVTWGNTIHHRGSPSHMETDGSNKIFHFTDRQSTRFAKGYISNEHKDEGLWWQGTNEHKVEGLESNKNKKIKDRKIEDDDIRDNNIMDSKMSGNEGIKSVVIRDWEGKEDGEIKEGKNGDFERNAHKGIRGEENGNSESNGDGGIRYSEKIENEGTRDSKRKENEGSNGDEGIRDSERNEDERIRDSEWNGDEGSNGQEKIRDSERNEDERIRDSERNEYERIRDSERNEDERIRDSERNEDERIRDSERNEDERIRDSERNDDERIRDSERNEDERIRDSEWNGDEKIRDSKRYEDERIRDSERNEDEGSNGEERVGDSKRNGNQGIRDSKRNGDREIRILGRNSNEALRDRKIADSETNEEVEIKDVNMRGLKVKRNDENREKTRDSGRNEYARIRDWRIRDLEKNKDGGIIVQEVGNLQRNGSQGIGHDRQDKNRKHVKSILVPKANLSGRGVQRSREGSSLVKANLSGLSRQAVAGISGIIGIPPVSGGNIRIAEGARGHDVSMDNAATSNGERNGMDWWHKFPIKGYGQSDLSRSRVYTTSRRGNNQITKNARNANRRQEESLSDTSRRHSTIFGDNVRNITSGDDMSSVPGSLYQFSEKSKNIFQEKNSIFMRGGTRQRLGDPDTANDIQSELIEKRLGLRLIKNRHDSGRELDKQAYSMTRHAPRGELDGQTGIITRHDPSGELDGQTGIITRHAPRGELDGQTGIITRHAPRGELDGQTGIITRHDPSGELDGQTGIITRHDPSGELDGQTGIITRHDPRGELDGETGIITRHDPSGELDGQTGIITRHDPRGELDGQTGIITRHDPSGELDGQTGIITRHDPRGELDGHTGIITRHDPSGELDGQTGIITRHDPRGELDGQTGIITRHDPSGELDGQTGIITRHDPRGELDGQTGIITRHDPRGELDGQADFITRRDSRRELDRQADIMTTNLSEKTMFMLRSQPRAQSSQTFQASLGSLYRINGGFSTDSSSTVEGGRLSGSLSLPSRLSKGGRLDQRINTSTSSFVLTDTVNTPSFVTTDTWRHSNVTHFHQHPRSDHGHSVGAMPISQNNSALSHFRQSIRQNDISDSTEDYMFSVRGMGQFPVPEVKDNHDVMKENKFQTPAQKSAKEFPENTGGQRREMLSAESVTRLGAATRQQALPVLYQQLDSPYWSRPSRKDLQGQALGYHTEAALAHTSTSLVTTTASVGDLLLVEVSSSNNFTVKKNATTSNYDLQVRTNDTISNYDLQVRTNDTISSYDLQVRTNDTISNYDLQVRTNDTISNYDLQVTTNDTISSYDLQVRTNDTISSYDLQTRENGSGTAVSLQMSERDTYTRESTQDGELTEMTSMTQREPSEERGHSEATTHTSLTLEQTPSLVPTIMPQLGHFRPLIFRDSMPDSTALNQFLSTTAETTFYRQHQSLPDIIDSRQCLNGSGRHRPHLDTDINDHRPRLYHLKLENGNKKQFLNQHNIDNTGHRQRLDKIFMDNNDHNQLIDKTNMDQNAHGYHVDDNLDYSGYRRFVDGMLDMDNSGHRQILDKIKKNIDKFPRDKMTRHGSSVQTDKPSRLTGRPDTSTPEAVNYGSDMSMFVTVKQKVNTTMSMADVNLETQMSRQLDSRKNEKHKYTLANMDHDSQISRTLTNMDHDSQTSRTLTNMDHDSQTSRTLTNSHERDRQKLEGNRELDKFIMADKFVTDIPMIMTDKHMTDIPVTVMSKHVQDTKIMTAKHMTDTPVTVTSKHVQDTKIMTDKHMTDIPVTVMSKHVQDIKIMTDKHMTDIQATVLSKHVQDTKIMTDKHMTDIPTILADQPDNLYMQTISKFRRAKISESTKVQLLSDTPRVVLTRQQKEHIVTTMMTPNPRSYLRGSVVVDLSEDFNEASDSTTGIEMSTKLTPAGTTELTPVTWSTNSHWLDIVPRTRVAQPPTTVRLTTRDDIVRKNKDSKLSNQRPRNEGVSLFVENKIPPHGSASASHVPVLLQALGSSSDNRVPVLVPLHNGSSERRAPVLAKRPERKLKNIHKSLKDKLKSSTNDNVSGTKQLLESNDTTIHKPSTTNGNEKGKNSGITNRLIDRSHSFNHRKIPWQRIYLSQRSSKPGGNQKFQSEARVLTSEINLAPGRHQEMIIYLILLLVTSCFV